MPTMLDLDDLPADVRSELQTSADEQGLSVQDVAARWLRASVGAGIVRKERALPAPRPFMLPDPDNPLDIAPNEEATRLVDEYLLPRLEELRRQPGGPVTVVIVET